jgi:carboxylesterase
VSGPPIQPGAEPFRLGAGPTGVVMIHGFTGSPASMRPLGDWFAAQGLAALGVRLPGHGTNPADLATARWTDWVDEADARLTEAVAGHERVVLFAQSMGAAVALLLAARRPKDVAGLALSNPYVHDRRLMLVPVGRLFIPSVKGVGSDIKKPGAREVAYDRIPSRALSSLRELLKAADRDLPRVTAPLVLFRSGEDHVIPKGNARRVLDRVGSTRKDLVPCPNSYHVISLDNDAPMVAESVLAFVRSL